jgi:hypothetical protein
MPGNIVPSLRRVGRLDPKSLLCQTKLVVVSVSGNPRTFLQTAIKFALLNVRVSPDNFLT